MLLWFCLGLVMLVIHLLVLASTVISTPLHYCVPRVKHLFAFHASSIGVVYVTGLGHCSRHFNCVSLLVAFHLGCQNPRSPPVRKRNDCFISAFSYILDVTLVTCARCLIYDTFKLETLAHIQSNHERMICHEMSVHFLFGNHHMCNCGLHVGYNLFRV